MVQVAGSMINEAIHSRQTIGGLQSSQTNILLMFLYSSNPLLSKLVLHSPDNSRVGHQCSSSKPNLQLDKSCL